LAAIGLKPSLVPALRPDFYAQWRAQQEAESSLRERDSTHPPERLLQNVWHHQRLRRDDLRTGDGRIVRVLHPGFWNRGAGPDFRSAVIQFGQEEPLSGDVEIDVIPQNWRAHHHNTNQDFAGVILHVVWAAESEAGNDLPILPLRDFLDMPLVDMHSWAAGGASESWPESLRGACSAPLSQLNASQTEELLRQAALVRFERKARELETRARQAGWEQALWEGLFRGLGYKQNVWAMQRVAELVPSLREGAGSLVAMQARLLGASGFLPADLPEASKPAEHLRNLWDHWWRDRDRFRNVLLPKIIWRMHGLRPANQPQRRLALASHWLMAPDFHARLEKWFTQDQPDDSLASSLLECLQPAQDDCWSWHWGFASSRLRKPQPLLGESRATDLAINIILPWFWARARAGKNDALAAAAEKRYLAWPAAQDNSLLRLARHRLLGGLASIRLKTASSQQGLLQIIHDFCDQTDALCTDCRFPDLVRNCG
jgi:Protein of unknown function (DUF2851)